MNVRQERTGWRDEKLSRRHREWGWDCPMVDIDWLYIEYDYGHPKALVEYKHENAEDELKKIIERDRLHPSYKAQKELADNSRIPYLITLYADNLTWYRVHPMNDYARQYIGETTKMSELEYVTLLYRMRGRIAPDDILEKLKNTTQTHFR